MSERLGTKHIGVERVATAEAVAAPFDEPARSPTVNAMRMPVNDLNSNWAYMVMAAQAWNLKAWFALLVPDRERGSSS